MQATCKAGAGIGPSDYCKPAAFRLALLRQMSAGKGSFCFDAFSLREPVSTSLENASPAPSNLQLVAALQIENLAGFVRGRNFKTEPFDDLAGERDLLGVGCRHSAGRRPQRVFESDPDIAAHCGGHRRDRQLIAP